MEPISMILLAIGLLAGATAAAGVIHIAYLTIREVLGWFRARKYLLRHDSVIATTVLQHMANGQYRTVQGVFNRRMNAWVEHRTIDSEWIDSDLAARHRDSRSVTYHI